MYNFGFDIINEWVEARSEFERSDSIEKIMNLMRSVMNRTILFENIYWKEVLGMKTEWKWKVEDYMKAYSIRT